MSKLKTNPTYKRRRRRRATFQVASQRKVATEPGDGYNSFMTHAATLYLFIRGLLLGRTKDPNLRLPTTWRSTEGNSSVLVTVLAP